MEEENKNTEEQTQVTEEIENQEEFQEQTKEDIQVDEQNKNIEKTEDILEEKGIDFNQLQEEYKQNNGFTEETKQKLQKIGITEDVVNCYIEGQKARAEQEINKLAECVGGRESFDEILKWTAKNVDKAEIEAINKVTDPAIVKIILKDLQGRMVAKEGKLPSYVNDTAGGNAKPEVFESQLEMREAILDPRYQKDEVYRKKVMKKISASREAGINLGC